jgi:hypothetical protein
MLKRLPLLLVSGLAMALAAGVAVRALTASKQRTIDSTRALLESGVRYLESDLASRGSDLPELAAKVSSDPTLGLDLKMLLAAVNFAQGNRNVPPAVQARIDTVRGSIDGRFGAFRTEHTDLDGLALVSETGVVLLSSSPHFVVGSNVAPVHQAMPTTLGPNGEPALRAPAPGGGQPAGAGAAAAAPAVMPGIEPGPLDPVLDGGLAHGIASSDENLVYYWGAAPVSFKGKIVGGVLAERVLRALPQAPGLEHFLVVGGTVTIGKAPAGYAAEAAAHTDKAFLMAERSAGSAFGERAFLAGTTRPGVWANRFVVRGVPSAYGFVTADVTPVLEELTNLQMMILVLGAVLWLVHAVMLLLVGQRLRFGVERVADYLGQAQKGGAGVKPLNERDLPRELGRLSLLVNKLVERTGGVAPGSLPKAPTLDEVIQAQEVTSPINVGELHFEGITNAGSLGARAPEAKAAPPPPPPPLPADEEGGFQTMSDVSALEFGGAGASAGSKGALPELPDALKAVDQLSGLLLGGSSAEWAAAEEAPPPVAIGRVAPVKAAAVRPSAPPAPVESWADASDAPAAPLPPPGEGVGGSATVSDEMFASLSGMSASGVASADAEGANGASGGVQLSAELAAQLHELAGEGSTGDLPAPVRSTPPARPVAASSAAAASITTPPPAPAGSAGGDEAHFRDVYDQFVSTRKSCGEAGELSYDKFRTRLEESRAAVIAKHNCLDVRFQVYVKNGKAALKATPVLAPK